MLVLFALAAVADLPSGYALDTDCAALVDQARAGEAVDLAKLGGGTDDCLVVVRNAVFARHGRPFKNESLRAFFAAQPWYRENTSYTDAILTSADKAVVEWFRARDKQDKAFAAIPYERWKPAWQRICPSDVGAKSGVVPARLQVDSPAGPVVLQCRKGREPSLCTFREKAPKAKKVTRFCADGSRSIVTLTTVRVTASRMSPGDSLPCASFIEIEWTPDIRRERRDACFLVEGDFGERGRLEPALLLFSEAESLALQERFRDYEDPFTGDFSSHSMVPADFNRDGLHEALVVETSSPGPTRASTRATFWVAVKGAEVVVLNRED